MAENTFRLQYEARRQIRRLSSLSFGKRCDALARLSALGQDGRDALHRVLNEERGQWENRKGSLSCMLLAMSALGLLLAPVVLSYYAPYSIASIGLLVLLVSLIVSGVLSMRRPASGYQTCIAALTHLGDLSSINWLIDGLEKADAHNRAAVSAAVTALLPTVNRMNCASITQTARATLYRQLGSDDSQLIVAILNATVLFRDDAALPELERLSASTKPAAQTPAVRAALDASLPVIREIHARVTGRKTLLRAASPHDAEPHMALRAALAPGDSSSLELLRAGVTSNQSSESSSMTS